MKSDTARRARQQPAYQLKHRVTGAALIAAGAGLAVAVLLGGPGGGDGDAQTIRFDFGEAVTVDSTVKTESDTVDTEVAVTALPDAAAPISSDAESTASTVAQTGWAVQVGAFDEPSGIIDTVAKFQAGGFPVITVAPKSGGKLTRVWLGPYPDRRAANNARRRAIEFGAPDDSFVVEP